MSRAGKLIDIKIYKNGELAEDVNTSFNRVNHCIWYFKTFHKLTLNNSHFKNVGIFEKDGYKVVIERINNKKLEL